MTSKGRATRNGETGCLEPDLGHCTNDGELQIFIKKTQGGC